MTTTARCPRCGADRPTHAAFCSKCGVRMPPPSAQAGAAPPASGQASAPPPSSWRKIGGWLGAAAILMIGGGLRQIGLTVARHPQQATSLFHNPFGPHPLATSLRQFQRGDSWEYRVSGAASLTGGRTGTITDGTLKVAITGLEIADFDNLIETNDIDLTFSDGTRTLPFSHSLRESLSQNLMGSTYLMSDNGGPQDSTRHVRQPQVDTPGSWAVGTIQSVHLDFDDGESRDETLTVQGSEVADTVLGRLTVWRCTQDEADSDGTKTATTLWFAPQLGMPVRTSGTTTNPDGMVLTLTTELAKTSVPL